MEVTLHFASTPLRINTVESDLIRLVGLRVKTRKDYTDDLVRSSTESFGVAGSPGPKLPTGFEPAFFHSRSNPSLRISTEKAVTRIKTPEVSSFTCDVRSNPVLRIVTKSLGETQNAEGFSARIRDQPRTP